MRRLRVKRHPCRVHPSLRALAAAQGDVFTHQQALHAGYPHEEVRRLVEAGTWIRLRYGVLSEPAVLAAARAAGVDAWRLLQLRAVLVRVGRGVVASHESGALIRGLPIERWPSHHILTSARGRPRTARGYVVQRAGLPDFELETVDGFRTTTAARCVMDIARCRRLIDGLVVADGALNRKACTTGDLTLVLESQAHWPGQAQAARVIELADGLAESAKETVLRLFVLEEGLPRPRLQLPVRGASGRWYRGDLGWEELRTIGEFDGRGKYDSARRLGPGHPLWEEKIREDDLRAAGWQFVRVVNEDFAHRYQLRSRFEAAFARGMRAA